MDDRGFGGDGRGADYDAGNADEIGDIGCGEVADADVRYAGVQEDLVGGQFDVSLGGVHDALGALLEGCFELCGC